MCAQLIQRHARTQVAGGHPRAQSSASRGAAAMMWVIMQEFSTSQIRMAFFAFLLFCVSIFMSCREVSYMFWGRTIEADLTDRGIVRVPQRRGSVEKMRLGYRFVDPDGHKREGYQLYEPDEANVPQGPKVSVEYLSGQHGASRLAGRRQWFWPIVMVGLPIGVVVRSIVYVKRETRRPHPGGRGRR